MVYQCISIEKWDLNWIDFFFFAISKKTSCTQSHFIIIDCFRPLLCLFIVWFQINFAFIVGFKFEFHQSKIMFGKDHVSWKWLRESLILWSYWSTKKWKQHKRIFRKQDVRLDWILVDLDLFERYWRPLTEFCEDAKFMHGNPVLELKT